MNDNETTTGELVASDAIPATTASAPVALSPEASGALSPLMQLIANNDMPLDKISQLMDLQERDDKRQAKKAYDIAMAEFRKRAPVLKQDREVDFNQTHYKYTSLGYAMSEVNPIAGECGLSLTWNVEQANGQITVTCILAHAGGHTTETSLTAPPDTEGKKTGIKAIKSTITYLERVTAFALLGLSSSFDDDGGAAEASRAGAPNQASKQAATPVRESLSDGQQSTIIELLDRMDELSAGYSAKWREHYEKKYRAIDTPLGLDMPASHYDSAAGALNKKIQELTGASK